MIKSLSILNFQSHDKSKLDFSPGVNVIVGSSDSGKTSIIRAIRWLSWNRPSGDALRSNWGGATNVLLETEEGIVRRVKDKKDHYELKLKDGKSLVFTAFGTNVPQEITAFLNLNEVNIQHQLDSPFLLSDTPGGVASHFNKVARLDKIDTATSTINGWIRGLKSDVDHLESDLETERGKLTKFEHLEKFEADVEVLEETQQQLTVLKSRKDVLKGLIISHKQVTESIEELTPMLELEELVNNLISKKQELKTLQETYASLWGIIDTIEDNVQGISQQEEFITISPLLDDLIAKYDQVRALQSDVLKLKSLIRQISQSDQDALTTKSNMEVWEERFHKEMPDECPLCGHNRTLKIMGAELSSIIIRDGKK